MKNNNIASTTFAILVSALCPIAANADCGYLPSPPSLLDNAQLTEEESVLLDSQMTAHIDSIESYKSCLDGEISDLGANVTDVSYFESNAYQAAYQNLSSLIETATSQLEIVVDRHNQLLKVPLAQ